MIARYFTVCLLILSAVMTSFTLRAENSNSLMPGLTASRWYGEQTRLDTTENGVRIYYNVPGSYNEKLPTLVVFYATPNGNTLEQTLGCKMKPGMDWHFDIQHIAAQTRKLREIDKSRNIVLVLMQPEIKSWPTWRQKTHDSNKIIKRMIEDSVVMFPGSKTTAVITGHSGGGSMIFGFINACDEIPDWVERIAFLDANYGYSDDLKHGDKLARWLHSDSSHQLVVIAYDDRDIMLDGKPVVTTGGTFRASYKILNRFEKNTEFTRTTDSDIDRFTGINERITIYIHRNPKNKILHTALIGEMNGYLEALTIGTDVQRKWGTFGGPRAYTKWVQQSQ